MNMARRKSSPGGSKRKFSLNPLVWLWRIFFWGFCAVVLLQLWYLAQIAVWTHVNPSSTSFMQTRLAEIRKTEPGFQLKHEWVPYDKISLNLKRAVIAAEDSGFMTHKGVEMEAIQLAIKRNERRGRVTHGGSTITQQLAKNLFLTSKRSYIRKGQELVIALMIEALWDKRRILEVYLNVVEWGNGVYGAQAGAKHHYGVGAAQLSSYQAARMAGMLPAPRYFDKRRNSRFLARKTGTLQKRMYQVTVPG
ncbi:MAG: monofunctional biosynthetic peptidoglycan transglycosylase [Gammaproteobacteria bacterium]|nr:monofunctional biosynthetic peptidoglycan transglycosylase [Gammaproteobacteria bacterium]